MGTCQSQTSHSTFSVVCIVNTVVFPRSQLFVCTMSHFAFPIVLTGSMPLQAFCHWQFYKDTFDTSSESVKENDVSQDEKDETASNDVDTNDDASGWNTAPTRLPRRCSLSVAFDRVNQRTNSSGVQCAPVSVHLSTYDFHIRHEEVSMLCARVHRLGGWRERVLEHDGQRVARRRQEEEGSQDRVVGRGELHPTVLLLWDGRDGAR